MTIVQADLQALVAGWLPRQRWFGGKGRELRAVDVRPLAALTHDGPEVSIWLIEVSYEDGVLERYQLPLVAHDEPVDHLEHVQLGTITDDGRVQWIYDALHDKDVTGLWLLGIRDQADVGALHFERTAAVEDIPTDEPSLVLTGEQSNTSLVFGDRAILKVFRRLEPGLNPDIEVHRALTERGAVNVAQLLGSLSTELDGEPTSLAMLQEFMSTASDGWDLAKISVRDLMAEADLHAEEAGGDFAGEAERLGQATAAIHADLAMAFGTVVIGAQRMRERADRMNERLDAALLAIPELAPVESGLRAAFAAFAAAGEDDSALRVAQRIHGDLHLGQALRTVRRWILLDFEGEPLRSMDERREFDSPLRDVAGMLRSFDYAARHQLVDSAMDAQLEYRANEWAERNRDAFCLGYAEISGADPRRHEAVLRGFEADKAVYEAIYEARNRPSWLRIPLASLVRLSLSDDGPSAMWTNQSTDEEAR
jgi:maltokinase